MVSDNFIKFSGQKHCGSRDINFLVCHMILQNHVIKRSCNTMGRNPSRLVTKVPSLVAIRTVVVEVCF